MKITKQMKFMILISGMAVAGVAHADGIDKFLGNPLGRVATVTLTTAPIPSVEREVIYVRDPYYYHAPYRHDNGLHLGKHKHKSKDHKNKHDDDDD